MGEGGEMMCGRDGNVFVAFYFAVLARVMCLNCVFLIKKHVLKIELPTFIRVCFIKLRLMKFETFARHGVCGSVFLIVFI